MKISLNWIKEFVDLPADEVFSNWLMISPCARLKAEGFEDLGSSLDKIVTAKSYLLRLIRRQTACVVKVDAAEDEPCQVVCGGNLEVGQMVVLAKPGSYVRWHGEGEPLEIKASKLRGRAFGGDDLCQRGNRHGRTFSGERRSGNHRSCRL